MESSSLSAAAASAAGAPAGTISSLPAVIQEPPTTTVDDLSPTVQTQPPSDEQVTAIIMRKATNFNGALGNNNFLVSKSAEVNFNDIRWSFDYAPEMVAALTMHWAALFKVYFSQVSRLGLPSPKIINYFDRVVALPYRQVSKICLVKLSDYMRQNKDFPDVFSPGAPYPFFASMEVSAIDCAQKLANEKLKTSKLSADLAWVNKQIALLEEEFDKSRNIVTEAQQTKKDMEDLVKEYKFSDPKAKPVDTLSAALKTLFEVATLLGANSMAGIKKATEECKKTKEDITTLMEYYDGKLISSKTKPFEKLSDALHTLSQVAEKLNAGKRMADILSAVDECVKLGADVDALYNAKFPRVVLGRRTGTAVAQLTTLIDDLQKNTADLQKDLNDCTSGKSAQELMTIRGEAGLRAEIDELKHERDRLREEVARCNTERFSLRDDLDRKTDQAERLRRSSEKKDAKLLGREEQLKDAKKQLKECLEREKQMQLRITQLEKDVSDANKKKDIEFNRAVKAESKVDELTRDAAARFAEYTRATLDEKRKELVLQDCQKKLSAAETQLEQKTDALSSATGTLKQKELEVTSLQTRMQTLTEQKQAESARAEKLQKEVNEIKSAQMETTQIDFSVQLEQKDAEIRRLQGISASFESLKAQLTATELQLRQNEIEAVALKRANSELTAARQQLSQDAARFKTMSDDCDREKLILQLSQTNDEKRLANALRRKDRPTEGVQLNNLISIVEQDARAADRTATELHEVRERLSVLLKAAPGRTAQDLVTEVERKYLSLDAQYEIEKNINARHQDDLAQKAIELEECEDKRNEQSLALKDTREILQLIIGSSGEPDADVRRLLRIIQDMIISINPKLRDLTGTADIMDLTGIVKSIQKSTVSERIHTIRSKARTLYEFFGVQERALEGGILAELASIETVITITNTYHVQLSTIVYVILRGLDRAPVWSNSQLLAGAVVMYKDGKCTFEEKRESLTAAIYSLSLPQQSLSLGEGPVEAPPLSKRARETELSGTGGPAIQTQSAGEVPRPVYRFPSRLSEQSATLSAAAATATSSATTGTFHFSSASTLPGSSSAFSPSALVSLTSGPSRSSSSSLSTAAVPSAPGSGQSEMTLGSLITTSAGSK